MKKVNYVTVADEHMASFRYRIANLFPHLSKVFDVFITKGPRFDADIIVMSKHFDKDAGYDALNAKAAIVMDVCDNHFESAEHGEYYRTMCTEADLVTCNSRAMREEIEARVPGVKTRVIPEPYEMPELSACPYFHNPPRLMWFGHPSNLDTLEDVNFPGKLYIVTGNQRGFHGNVNYLPYSHDMMIGTAGISDAVIIPTLPKLVQKVTKSANRFIEALRLGKFVIAGNSPAHDEFAGFGYIGETLDGCKWLLSNTEEAMQRIAKGQEYIKERYSPQAIAGRWRAVFDEVLSSHD